MAGLVLPAGQQRTAFFQARDASGASAPITEPPTWETNDRQVIDLHPAQDGMSCTIVGLMAGSAQVTAQMGDIVAIEDITVTSGDAAMGSISFAGSERAGRGGGGNPTPHGGESPRRLPGVRDVRTLTGEAAEFIARRQAERTMSEWPASAPAPEQETEAEPAPESAEPAPEHEGDESGTRRRRRNR